MSAMYEELARMQLRETLHASPDPATGRTVRRTRSGRLHWWRRWGGARPEPAVLTATPVAAVGPAPAADRAAA